jgi:hypothetical protein
MEAHMLHAFLWNMLAFTIIGLLIVWSRYRIELLHQQVESTYKAAYLSEGAGGLR